MEKKDIRKCEARGKGILFQSLALGTLAAKSRRVLSALGAVLKTAAK